MGALEHYKQGEVLRADTVNALIDKAQQQPAHEVRPVTREVSVIAHSTEVIYPYCAFLLDKNHKITRFVASISNPISPLRVWTNGKYEIPANAKGRVVAIGDMPRPVRVSSGAAWQGKPCGILDGSQSLTQDRLGLLSITDAYPAPNSFGQVADVILGALANVCGIVTTSAPARSGNTFGKGYLKAQYNATSMGLVGDAPDPNGSSLQWVLPFYNLTTTSVPVGAYVVVHSCIGCYLVYQG